MVIKDHHYVFTIMTLAMCTIVANVAALFVTETIGERVTLLAVFNGFALTIVGYIMILVRQDKSDHKQDEAAKAINGRLHELVMAREKIAFNLGKAEGLDDNESAHYVLAELRKSVPPRVLEELRRRMLEEQENAAEPKQQGSKEPRDLNDPNHNIGVAR